MMGAISAAALPSNEAEPELASDSQPDRGLDSGNKVRG